MSAILVVEDEERIAEFLTRGLASHGYRPVVAADGAAAIRALQETDYALVILDLGLPEVDGLEVLRQLRGQGSTVPVLILSARGGPEHTITGLDAGADDYLSKPFRFDELLARIRARLRTDVRTTDAVLTCGPLALDLLNRRASLHGSQIEMSGREVDLLEALMRRPGDVLSREQILSDAWGYSHDPESNIVDVYIGYLRRKLGADAIRTVRGIGYCLDIG